MNPLTKILNAPLTLDKDYECFCAGPQDGEPLCKCRMRDVIVRDGRYFKNEVDLGPCLSNES